MSRLIINPIPNNLYIKRKDSQSCLKNVEYGKKLRVTKWLRTYNTKHLRQQRFTILGQFHNGGSKKTNPNPSPNPPKTLNRPKALTLPKP